MRTFKEKPAEPLARQYFADPAFAWNSGMFVWQARTILEQLRQHLPAAYEGHMRIAAAWGTPQQEEVLNRVYPTLPKGPIDTAVMEKAPHVALIPLDIRWLDVGSWPAYGETLAPDVHGNRTGGTAGVRAQHLASSNILAISEQPHHVIATINCHDLIIIHTPQATLVCPAADAEKIKQLVAEVEKQQGSQYV